MKTLVPRQTTKRPLNEALLSLALVILWVGLWLRPVPVIADDEPVMEIGVSGMVCRFCSARVARELKALPGVKTVTVDLKGGHAAITLNDGERLEATAVREAIEAAGFKPGEVITTGEATQ